MAKKKQTKKHKFKYAEPAGPGLAASAPMRGDVQAPAAGASSSPVSSRDYSYVGHDMRRILVLVVSLVAIEVALWGVLTHTAAGDFVYSLIRV